MISMLACLLLVLMKGQYFLPMDVFLGLAGLSIAMGGAVLSGKIDVAGALVGGIIGIGIFLGGGFAALGLLLIFFVAGSAVSHWRRKEKAQLGLAQENEGKRSVRHAISNGGIAALCGLLAWGFPDISEVLLVALAASFSSATADTFSSELGNVLGKRYVDVLSFKAGTRGHDGVISLEGTFMGAIGSLILALAYGWGHEWNLFVLIVWLSGLLGNHIDSILGATVQRKGYLSNDEVNLLSSFLAALIGGVLAAL